MALFATGRTKIRMIEADPAIHRRQRPLERAPCVATSARDDLRLVVIFDVKSGS